eukprot:scaffold2088_cov399-Prasinococcus_capsulatus_cf.AAC.15
MTRCRGWRKASQRSIDRRQWATVTVAGLGSPLEETPGMTRGAVDKGLIWGPQPADRGFRQLQHRRAAALRQGRLCCRALPVCGGETGAKSSVARSRAGARPAGGERSASDLLGLPPLSQPQAFGGGEKGWAFGGYICTRSGRDEGQPGSVSS